MTRLELRAVTVDLPGPTGPRRVLDETTLSLTEGRVALVGPNGSGKSTLARLFNGLVRPSSGQVLVDDVDVARDPAGVRRRVGFAFTDPAAQLVMPTVLEDVSLSLRKRHRDKDERRVAALEVLARHGVEDLAEQSVHTLSGGQRQLVALAGVLATDPDVLRAVDRFQTTLDATPDITGVAGPTSPLRMRSYLGGHGDTLAYLDDVEQLMLMQPELRAFISPDLTDLQLTILFRHGGAHGYAATAHRIDAAWKAAVASSPALRGAEMHVVGQSLLEAKVGASLVPTLAESFCITVVLILLVFLAVFRSGLERLLAMIPSVFALLVTFLGLRLFGGNRN